MPFLPVRKVQMRRKGFTLIELLVVISIIALLLSILVPSLSKAKKSAQLVLCRNNLHQWAVAIEAFATEHEGTAPLSTTYGWTGTKVTASYPNEMYLDRYNMHAINDKDLQKKMISQEAIAPYLVGFNDKGMRTTDPGSPGNFSDYPDNWQLDGVWRCPSAKRQELGDTLERLTEAGRSYFRLDYSYIGRVDLWDDTMFQRSQTQSVDKGALVGKYPSSGRIMLTDTIFYWDVGDAEETIYIYNHGSQGPSGWSNTSGSYFKPPRDIEGMNQAFGDGSVEWKKIDSDDRFKSDGFAGRNNRYTFMGFQGYLFY
jgi:prepilin-type N-terminal cleavage/methylation domain-containing protein